MSPVKKRGLEASFILMSTSDLIDYLQRKNTQFIKAVECYTTQLDLETYNNSGVIGEEVEIISKEIKKRIR